MVQILVTGATGFIGSHLCLVLLRKGYEIKEESDVKAERGAYFINSEISLACDEKKEWLFAADINKSSSDIATLKKELTTNNELTEKVNDEILNSSNELFLTIFFL